LLDEPFNAIDTKTVDDLVGVIERWHAEKRSVIAVMHDLELVRNHFPNAMLLSREPIAWGPTEEVLQADNLRRARRFHAAWDEDAPWCADHDHKHAHGQAA
jgi:zinc/manganese transport system ATP-binding protein